MKREEALLQQALTAARAKHELTARDLFLEVVEIDPCNELAWMWLTGLLDNLDDCIYACERVLEINPHNEQIRNYHAQLWLKKQKELGEQKQVAEKQIRHAVELAKAGQRETAITLIRDAVQKCEPGAEAWRLLAELSPEMEEQIEALKKLLALTPHDVKARETLNRLLHLRKHPQELAAIYEEQGKLDKAIELYYLALRQPQFKKQWHSIERKIVRLKMLRSEDIAHVTPTISIVRLAAGPPLVYLFMLLIHVGINPLAKPELLLWLEMFVTILGGLLITFAGVHSHHRLWYLLFKDVSRSGTAPARAFMATTGWMLVIFPFLHLFYTAFQRMVVLL
jgi:Tfp pilus assembly protein PilF